jgi:hypothetical protein
LTVYPTWRAGSKVTADRLTQQQTHTVIAAADQIINNSSVTTDDTELFFPLKANALYIVELHAAFNPASATPALKFGWSVPAGTTGGRFHFGSTSNAGTFTDNQITRASVRSEPFTTVIVNRTGTLDQSFNEILSLITLSTPGNVQFRWAQNTATVANTTRLADSFMRVTRVG